MSFRLLIRAEKKGRRHRHCLPSWEKSKETEEKKVKKRGLVLLLRRKGGKERRVSRQTSSIHVV